MRASKSQAETDFEQRNLEAEALREGNALVWFKFAKGPQATAVWMGWGQNINREPPRMLLDGQGSLCILDVNPVSATYINVSSYLLTVFKVFL